MASSSRPKPLTKGERAKFAKDTLNNRIPHILKSNLKAQRAVASSELIYFLSSPKKAFSKTTLIGTAASVSGEPTQPASLSLPRIRAIKSDTFDAAQSILTLLPKHTSSRVAVLNMASALRPGGGVLNGSLAQEETLCVRSTLYPSLKDTFYRIPDTAAIYSPDILVFRGSDHAELPKTSWFYVDVISCAAPKAPEIAEGKTKKERMYASEADRDMMMMRVKLVLQVAMEKGITHLVLGAWGCGAYGNPPVEVAKIFKRVLCGDRRRSAVTGIKEVVFAIFDDGENLDVFTEAFPNIDSRAGGTKT